MTWILPTPPDVDGPTTGDERAMVAGYLDWQRHTLLNICAGLTGEQLVQRAVPSSALTLLGLVRHLAKVERAWFVERFGGLDLPPMYPGAKDADFLDLDPARAPEDLERYLAITTQAAQVAAGVDLDATITHRDGRQLSLRFVQLHVIHEYARHNGHADLIREAIDGVTGR